MAAQAQQDAHGQAHRAPLTFGGNDVAAAQADLPYNNGSVFDAQRLDVAAGVR